MRGHLPLSEQIREALLGALLLMAAVLVVTGVACWSGAAAFITAGVLLAVWSLAMFLEVKP